MNPLLVEVVWKVCLSVVNFWLKQSVTLHDKLFGGHGFREWRGMGTATLEDNLLQQLAGISHKQMF